MEDNSPERKLEVRHISTNFDPLWKKEQDFKIINWHLFKKIRQEVR